MEVKIVGGVLQASKRFSDPTKTFVADSYTGGIPSGETLGSSVQGIIVYYSIINSPGNQIPEWNINEYVDGTGNPLSFTVRVFLVEKGRTTKEDEKDSPKVVYA